MLISNIPNTLTIWLNMLFLLSRYAHIVAAMLLVGGFLFYEMVVPIAIADLKEQTQIAVFARARWVFRWIIWFCVATMILSGVYMTIYRMETYMVTEFPQVPAPWTAEALQTPWILRTGWWWAAHVVSAAIAMLVALHLVAGDRMPRQPLGWLKLDLMLLLIVIFFATVTRQVDYIQRERMINLLQPSLPRYIYSPSEDQFLSSQPSPATAPADSQ